jgi:hypothetical protein
MKMTKILIFLLSIILIVVTLFLSGCFIIELINKIDDEDKMTKEEWEHAEEIDRMREAQKEEKQTDVEQEAPNEEPAEEVAEEAEKSIPDKPLTYTGSIGEEGQVPIAVILIVNFKTKKVTGSLSYGGEGINTYVDATITEGKIKLDILEINSKYSGVAGSKAVEGSEGVEYQINGTITGTITDDLRTFNGEMKSEEGAQKFTATR